MVADGTRDQRRDQVARLVGFLRELVQSRSVVVSDVDDHPGVLWVAKPAAISVRSGAGPGQVVCEVDAEHVAYSQLSAMVDDLTAQPESLELVVATALVTVCESDNDSESLVREHLLTQGVVAERDSGSGAIRLLVGSGAAPAMNDTRLLAGLDGIDLSETGKARSKAAALPGILGSPAGDVIDEWLERVDVDDERYSLTIEMRPAVVLRERGTAAALAFFDHMLTELRDPGRPMPIGLEQLVAPIEAADRVEALARSGALPAAEVVRDALYPLPSNVEQRDVLARLGSDSGVIVEGPPGTGKTQTIANVASALLAKGQRVLVVSEKADALHVLRDMLPEELRGLTVSLADISRDRFDAVVSGVEAIAERKASFAPAVASAEIDDLAARREQALTRRDRALRALWDLRASETQVHEWVAGDYRGTPAAIVRHCLADADKYDWIPGPLEGALPPLDAAELDRLLTLLRRQVGAVDRIAQRFPNVEEILPDSTTIQAICARINARPSEPMVGSGSLMSILSGVPSEQLLRIKTVCDQLALAAREVEAYPELIVDMTDRLLAGNEGHLWSRVTPLSPVIAQASERDRAIGAVAVNVDGAQQGDAALFDAAADYLAAGGRWRGRLRRSEAQRAVEESGVSALVDGQRPTDEVGLRRVADHLFVLETVRKVQRVLADLHVPVESSGSRSAQLNELVRLDMQLAWVSRLVSDRNQLIKDLEAISPGGPRPRSVAEVSEVAQQAGAIAAANDALFAEEELAECAFALSVELDKGPSPEGDALLAALAAADAEAISVARRSISAAKAAQDDQYALDLLTLRLRSKAPELCTLLTDTAQDPSWDVRLRDVGQAWDWRRAYTWVLDRSDPASEAKVAAVLAEAEVDLAQLTTKLCAARAWRACLERTTVAQMQALQAYRDHMINFGKGSGKHANRFRAAAREAMMQAQLAVPAWVMSINQAAETIPPRPNSFDVVIVDEASQADITSSFLLWLAPRVIVVGDDKQCAPSGLSGTTLEETFSRLDAYLPDLPHYLRDSLTPRSSLFSLLRSRFGHLLRLREQFRSMPEIIEFSSRQFYSGSPLVPVRQFGADRLPPLRTVAVAGEADGQGASLVNAAEADAIVSAIRDCLADPAYDGLDFGVIALQGTRQVEEIRSRLRAEFDEQTWRARRLRVGSPPDFQGDERRVMLLSMVVSDPGSIVALTRAESQRRFNVAASRAMDQMWVFHSIPPEQLSPGDLRRSLLEFMSANAGATIDPMPIDVADDVRVAPFESLFEQRVFNRLARRGYHVVPKMSVNNRVIDLVVTGSDGRLAVECDGDQFVSTGTQARSDLERERELTRCGWEFWRVRESEFELDADRALVGLWHALDARGVKPGSVPAPTVLSETDSASGESNSGESASSESEIRRWTPIDLDSD